MDLSQIRNQRAEKRNTKRTQLNPNPNNPSPYTHNRRIESVWFETETRKQVDFIPIGFFNTGVSRRYMTL